MILLKITFVISVKYISQASSSQSGCTSLETSPKPKTASLYREQNENFHKILLIFLRK